MSKLIEALAKIEDVIIAYAYGEFLVSFDDAWVKDGSALKGVWGTGGTAEEAASNYLNQIAGRLIVFEAKNGSGRHELYVIDCGIKEENK